MKTTIEITTVGDVYQFLEDIGILPMDWQQRVGKQGGIMIPWVPQEISVIELLVTSSERTKLIRVFQENPD